METQSKNLVEIRKAHPVLNKTEYTAIVNDNLNSVSEFSETSIVISELTSISQPQILVEEPKRKA